MAGLTRRQKLLLNAEHWLGQAKSNQLREDRCGAFFIFFELGDVESAVCASTVDKDRMRAYLRVILEKIDRMPIIVSPHGRTAKGN